MSRGQQGKPGSSTGPADEVELSASVRRARMYLDAAAPRDAHEILSKIVHTVHLSPVSDELELEALTLLLECCLDLGHEDHLGRWGSKLDRLRGTSQDGPADAFIRATAVLSRVALTQARVSEALALCLSVSPELLEAASAQTAIALLSHLEEVHRRQGDLDQAEAAVARALDRAERDGEAALQGNVRGLMAGLLNLRGRFPEALRLYNEAARLHRKGGDFTGMARDNLDRGWLLNRIGLLPECWEAFEEARRYARAIGLPRLTLRAELGLGMIAVRGGDTGAARPLLLSVWRRAGKQRMPREAALALGYWGEAQVLSGRPGQARRALGLYHRLAKRGAPGGDLAAGCEIRLAHLALSEGRHHEAEGHARTAARLSSEAGLAWEEAQARRLLGAALILLDRNALGQAELRESLRLSHGLNETFEIELTRAWMEYSGEACRAGVQPGFHPSWILHRGTAHGSAAVSSSPRPRPQEPDRGQVRLCRPGEGADSIWRRTGLVTQSPRLLRVLDEAAAVARVGDAVLILGETGTGKDLLARGIHSLSARPGALIPFNCAACPEDLVESELFGAERGAYTGADRRRDGLVLQAMRGTLFLDEIGDLPPRAQGSVLRFLDQGEVRALGSHVIRRVQVGLIAATHQPLYNQVESGVFRRDLFYRIAQKVLELPSLRERPEDLVVLIQQLWPRLNDGAAPPAWLMRDKTLETLRSHPWPGNVRELEHFLRRVRLVSGRELNPGEILRDLRGPSSSRPRAARVADEPIGPALERALRASGGNRREAAAILGISRAKLYRLLRAGDQPAQ
jgi:transcriptional regulator with AAA-type ATPase domain/tetratricopeptide (TPR) repeat protein